MEKHKSIKICIYLDCNTRCNYNFNGLPASYCASHKQPQMIDVNHVKCDFIGCSLLPYYNFEGNTKGVYCLSHKEPTMINVVSKRCVVENCQTLACFNHPGNKTPFYCSIHKTNEMTNVINKKCNFDNCKTSPSFNYEGITPPSYCFRHKLEGMVNTINKRCKFDNCSKIPSYNIEGEKQKLYCFEHKSHAMILIGAKICKSEWCTTVVRNKYEGYCLHCYIHLFPEKTVSRNYKTKERTVVEFVLQEFSQYSWTNDKQIQNGCSRRRPDLFVDFGYQILIIEIDENQHTGENYGDSSCENKRMMLLSQDVGHRPIVFIRFNPDDYYHNDEHITSCFGINSFGVCCVKKTKQHEWLERLNVLKKNIQYWCDHRLEKTLEIIPLFYSSTHTSGQSSGTKESNSS